MLDCPSGWMKFSGNCYQFNSETLSWQSAQHQCSSQEADLVSIHSELENNFTSRQVNPKSQRFWIGSARKADQSTEWTWTDGSSFDITNSTRASLTTEEDIRTVLTLAGWLKAKIAPEIPGTISPTAASFYL